VLDFYVGLHQPSDAWRFPRAFVSVTRLQRRQSNFQVQDWILDSGAFSTIARHGGYPAPVQDYADQIDRWRTCGRLRAAVTQDYMCEPWMVQRTGLSVGAHQQLTIDRYDQLCTRVSGVYIMPVLQGFLVDEYLAHVEMYGQRLIPGGWVGVGSVCKRNSTPQQVIAILDAIHRVRPDLRLHGFGIKWSTLTQPAALARLSSADSMAWSFAARREGRGRDANRWQEARRFVDRIELAIIPGNHPIEWP
jgi:hypothetical protein